MLGTGVAHDVGDGLADHVAEQLGPLIVQGRHGGGDVRVDAHGSQHTAGRGDLGGGAHGLHAAGGGAHVGQGLAQGGLDVGELLTGGGRIGIQQTLGELRGDGRGGQGVAQDVVQVSADALAFGGHREGGVAALCGVELPLQHLLLDAVPDAPGHGQAHHRQHHREVDAQPGGEDRDPHAHRHHGGHRPAPGQQDHVGHGLEHHHEQHVLADQGDQGEHQAGRQGEPGEPHLQGIQGDATGVEEHCPVGQQQHGGHHGPDAGGLDPGEDDRQQQEHRGRQGERHRTGLDGGPVDLAGADPPARGIVDGAGVGGLGHAGPALLDGGGLGVHHGHCVSAPTGRDGEPGDPGARRRRGRSVPRMVWLSGG